MPCPALGRRFPPPIGGGLIEAQTASRRLQGWEGFRRRSAAASLKLQGFAEAGYLRLRFRRRSAAASLKRRSEKERPCQPKVSAADRRRPH